MWSIFRDLGLLNQIGVAAATLGMLAGLAAAIAVAPVVGSVMGAIFIAVVVFSVWFFFGAEARRRRLLKVGQPGWATITAVEETGMTINNNYPIARLRLLVDAPGGEPYAATTRLLLDRFEIPAYQPGGRVQVVIDPKHRDKAAVT